VIFAMPLFSVCTNAQLTLFPSNLTIFVHFIVDIYYQTVAEYLDQVILRE
jgi:hypothetical protein